MKLVIAIPSHGAWEPAFGHSLALTMADLASNPMQAALRLVRCESSKLASGRMDLARDALKEGADKILWLDTDMQFRPANVRALLAHDLDIVAADYVKKTPRQESVCMALDGSVLTKQRVKLTDLGPQLGTSATPFTMSGVEEVAHAGMGLMVTKSDVFRRLPEPWFQFKWNPETRDDIGEDVFFCRLARENGFQVFVDHDASAGVGHVGRFVYRGD